MSKFKPILAAKPFSLPIEGRLLAHRRLLVELLRDLPDDRRARLLDWLDDGALYRHNHQDNGSAPGDRPREEHGGGTSDGVELELARADECQVLKRMVRTGSD
jgi:hypothetical protein